MILNTNKSYLQMFKYIVEECLSIRKKIVVGDKAIDYPNGLLKVIIEEHLSIFFETNSFNIEHKPICFFVNNCILIYLFFDTDNSNDVKLFNKITNYLLNNHCKIKIIFKLDDNKNIINYNVELYRV